MPIQAPKETPAIQQVRASGLTDCAQSSAAAASDSSPAPWSKAPWLRPTPRKLKRSAEKPRFAKRVEQVVDDLVVHRAAELRMRMQHDADRRAALLRRLVAALEAAGGPGEDDFRHGSQPLTALPVGRRRRTRPAEP